MHGSRVSERVRRHLDTQDEALNCVSAGRLIALPDESLQSPTAFQVQIARPEADEIKLLRLRGGASLLLDVRQRLLLDDVDEDAASPLLVAYLYRLLVSTEERYSELIAFHWTPKVEPPQRRYPHLHVGSVVTAGSHFRPKDFNRLHIPTGPVTLESVLLFAVEELGVEPAPGRDRAAVIDLLRDGDQTARRSRQPDGLSS